MSTNAHLIFDNNSASLEELCNSILFINKNIQSVVVINKNGRAIEKTTCNEKGLLIQDQKSEMYFMQCALQVSMGREFDDEFGEIGYIYVERKNLSMFSFPVDDCIIVITSKALVSPISLAKQIDTVISKYKGKSSVASNLK